MVADTTIEIIKAWQQAHDAADNNPQLLVKDAVAFGNLCAARMSVVLAAERMLYSVEKKDIPDELLKHLEANEAKGCGGCWMCSNPNRMHKDCQIKIDRWFATQQVLLEYARNFPARNGLSQL